MTELIGQAFTCKDGNIRRVRRIFVGPVVVEDDHIISKNLLYPLQVEWDSPHGDNFIIGFHTYNEFLNLIEEPAPTEEFEMWDFIKI